MNETITIKVQDFAEIIKTAVKEGVYEGIKQSKSKGVNKDEDMITTNEAFKIVPKARFYELVNKYGLKRTPKGIAPNSPKVVSKKELLRMHNTHP